MSFLGQWEVFLVFSFFKAHGWATGQTPPAPSFLRKHICSRFILPRAASENQHKLMQCRAEGSRRKWKGRASCLPPPTPDPLTQPAASPAWPRQQLLTGLFLSRLQLRLWSTSTNLIGIRSLCANSRLAAYRVQTMRGGAGGGGGGGRMGCVGVGSLGGSARIASLHTSWLPRF